MHYHQFYDKGLSHASYAFVDDGQMAIIDPSRDPSPYLLYAKEQGAEIIAILETHPHADFVSGHAELAQLTGADIYVSASYGASFIHKALKHGDIIPIGNASIKVLETPGHSPDSLTFLGIDSDGSPSTAFTGDTLFIGDVGRPDLRENVGNLKLSRQDLAREMYRSTRNVLMLLPAALEVLPAHGAGSLCGKALSSDLSSTIGREIASNYALQDMSEDVFVETLLADQPFMPAYFGYDVELNRKGAKAFQSSIDIVPFIKELPHKDSNALFIDVRPETEFKNGHLPGSINLQDGLKFETWLGSVVVPNEEYYLLATTEDQLKTAIEKAAKIGYEAFCKGLFIISEDLSLKSEKISAEELEAVSEEYQIIDVRNYGEYNERVIFPDAMHIPLPELRNRLSEIPQEKAIVVHCAAGYRSAAAQSIIEAKYPELLVLDLSDDVKKF
jgi:hydroxyacylglutathione hydrolase